MGSTELEGAVDALADKRRALMQLQLRRRRAKVAEGASVVAVSRAGRLPLSWQQAGLWFLQQVDPDSTTYHMPLVLRLRGPLDHSALAAALQAVIARHEGLRTRFQTVDGQPFQIIDPAPRRVELPVTDLPAVGWQRLVSEQVRRPFQLAAEAGFRCQLARLGTDDHVLSLTAHHIITDGWSSAILNADLSQAYAQARDGRLPDLPALPLQPADHAHWQHHNRDHLDAGLAYWRRQLADLPTLALPTDRPRPANPTGHGGGVGSQLDPVTSRQAAALANRLNTSLLAVLLAGFTLTLSRYTGSTDIPVGSVFSARTRTELEPLIGYFANSVVLRADLTGNPTAADHIQRCHATILNALRHQDTPFTLVVDTLRPPRTPGQNPLFQASLSLAPAQVTGGELALPGIDVEPVEVSQSGARFDLRFEVIPHADDSLEIWVEYATELFDEWRVRAMTEHFGNAVAWLVADPDGRLDDAELMSASQRRQVLHDFNRPEDQPPAPLPWAGRSVVAVAAEVARTAPGRCALWCGGSWLSYGQLDRAATELAVRLVAAGAGRGQVVGVCGHRSLELVIGLLAVLKAGAAYLPLDPDQPPARSRFQLADAGAVLLLAQPGVELTPPDGVRLIRLESPGQVHSEDPDQSRADEGCTGEESAVEGWADEGWADEVPGADTLPACCPTDPAYLIYTSGSTGIPKGVLNSHAGLINRLGWMQAQYPLGRSDRVLQKTPYTFDVSVWEFFWPLLTGARLVLADPGGHRDPGYLARVLTDQGISVTHFVPSVLATFLDQPDPPALPALRHLICSGEALSAGTRDRALARWPHARLHNLYGPTEASIDVTAWTCTPADGPTVVIGRPITNMRAYVLDARGRPAPVGVEGQLHLAGPGLAHHYVNRPALTAERFLPCPFGDPGQRMYATGDLARWRPDGALAYHGRTDDQIKLHGQRIELGEIEHTLLQHPAITAATVLLAPAADGRSPFLAAYLTTTGPVLGDAEIRAHLAERLPLHMLPATVTVLPELPITANGKLDRGRLPVPAAAPAGPPTSTERALAAIWDSLLSPATLVQGHHNFFTLGGSSLDLARLTAAVRDRCGVEIAIRDLYLAPTLAAMAALVDERAAGRTAGAADRPAAAVDRSAAGGDGRTAAAAAGQGSLVALRTGGSLPPVFLVHAIGGSAVPYLPLVHALYPEQPVYAFEAPGLHGAAGRRAGLAQSRSIPRIAAGYLAELRQVQPQGPYRLAGWSVGGLIAQEVAVQLRADGDDVALLALLDAVPVEAGAQSPDDAGLLSWFAHDLAGIRGIEDLRLDPALLADSPATERLERTLDHLVGQGIVEADDRAELATRFEVFAGLARAQLRHRPVALDRPTDLLVPETAEAAPRWQAIGGELRVHRVAGTHYTMLAPPHLSVTAAVLGALLEKSHRERGERR